MYRKFKIELDKRITHTKQCCIYKMFLGEYFYVGKSHQLIKRASMHKYENEGLLKQYWDVPAIFPESHYKLKVFQHLMKFPEINTIRFEVIQFCKRENLTKHEQKWLTHYEFDPMFLNVDQWKDRSYRFVSKDDL